MKNNKISLISLGLSKQSRREFMRKAIYASPVLLSLPATPSFAQQGSGGGGGAGDPGGVLECRPSEPVGGGQTEICHFGPAPSSIINSQDILVDESEVASHILHGDGFGTCNAFFCNAS